MQNLPVVMCADRAGLVGQDGETHQGMFDLSFFNLIPNLTIMAPKDFIELEEMLEFARERKINNKELFGQIENHKKWNKSTSGYTLSTWRRK